MAHLGAASPLGVEINPFIPVPPATVTNPSRDVRSLPRRNWRHNIDNAASVKSRYDDEQAGYVVEYLFAQFREKTSTGREKWPVVITLKVFATDNDCQLLLPGRGKSTITVSYCPEMCELVMQKLRAELVPQHMEVSDYRYVDHSISGAPQFWEFTFSDASERNQQRRGFAETLSRCEYH
jgi:hypothetical protein